MSPFEASASSPPRAIEASPTAISAASTAGLCSSSGCTRLSTRTPAATIAAARRYADTDVGARGDVDERRQRHAHAEAQLGLAQLEALDELAAFAARQPGVKDGERFLRQVSSLGAEDTIAVGGGAFLPHLRSDAVDRVVVVLGMTERPLRVPNETGEDSRGRIFALVAAPPEAVGASVSAGPVVAILRTAKPLTVALSRSSEPVASN